MRLFILIALLPLAGCSSLGGWLGSDGEVKQPPVAVPAPESLGALGNNIDKGDSKVAAAVTVMVESSHKPVVVENEGKVALAHLPKPDDLDLKAARVRAAAGDKNAYEVEISKAKAWLNSVEEDWNAALKQSKKNAEELTEARTRIQTLEKQVEDADRNLWTIAGVGLFVVGVLAGAIFGWRIGGSIVACAPLAGAIPVIINSEYFAWIVGLTIAIAACLLLWRLFDYIKDKNNEQP